MLIYSKSVEKDGCSNYLIQVLNIIINCNIMSTSFRKKDFTDKQADGQQKIPMGPFWGTDRKKRKFNIKPGRPQAVFYVATRLFMY